MPHIQDILNEHNLSATDAVRLYVDYLLEDGESKLIEREIQQLKWKIEDLEDKLAKAKAREARLRERGR